MGWNEDKLFPLYAVVILPSLRAGRGVAIQKKKRSKPFRFVWVRSTNTAEQFEQNHGRGGVPKNTRQTEIRGAMSEQRDRWQVAG